MNNLLKEEARKILKDLLAQCNEKQQLLFKRMYSHNNLDLPIDEVVDNMPDEKLDHAITQCERTVAKNSGLDWLL